MSNALFALAGVLLGSLIGFQIARGSIKDQFFYAAAAKLKYAFNDVLILLNLPKDKFIDIHAIEGMDNSFWKHEQAIIEFRYALPKSQRSCFDNAWINYKGYETGCDKLAKKYFGRDNWQQIALQDIEAILYFTEHNPSSLYQRLKAIYNKSLHRIKNR